jgi:hypothetical protein
MAARFWVTGGTGDWNSTTNWSATSGGASGASVPSTSDTATFNASSGSGTATLDISPDIQTLTCTGFTGTLAFGTNTISLNSTGTIFTGATTMTVTGTPLIICTNNSATARTLTPTAVTEANSISFRITAGTGTFSITTGNAVRDIDFTDGTNPTGYAGAMASSTFTVYGSFKASTGMTRTAGASVITFAATSGTKTINTAGVTFDCPFTFDGVGGTFQLQAALTSGATRTVTLTNGTLDLNNFTLTTGLFSSSNSNNRVLAFGTGKIVLTGNTATVWTNATGTNFTYTGTSRIEALGPATTGTRTFNPSTTATSTEANALNFYITGGSDTVTFSTTGRRINTLDFTGFTGTFSNSDITAHGNYTISAGMTVGAGAETTTFAATSGTKTITTNGKTLDFPVTFNGVGGTFQLVSALTSGATRTCTLTNGTLDLNGYTLTTGGFSTSNSNTRTLAFGVGKIVATGTNIAVWVSGTSTGLTLTGSKTVEFTGVGVSGQTRTISSCTVSSGGTISNAPNFYVKAGADSLDLGTAARVFTTLDFTGFSGTTLANATLNIYGDLVLSTGMTITGGANTWTFLSTTSQSITSSGVTINNPITFDGVGGVWSMQDALTLSSTRALTMTNGTLKLKAGTTNTVGAFATSGTNQKYLQSTLAGSRATLSQATGTVSVSYLTIQDSNATGGAFWDATASTNVNAGNNIGWDFSDVAINGIGNRIGFSFGFRV